MYIYIILSLIIAGYCKAQMDFIADSGKKDKDWKNKYKRIKNVLQPSLNHWWYFRLHKPAYQEKFIFSSTLLVFLTDKWHLWQFLMLRSFYFIIVSLMIIGLKTKLLLMFIVFPIILGMTFELVYRNKKKKPFKG
jgi:hypothetical protein